MVMLLLGEKDSREVPFFHFLPNLALFYYKMQHIPKMKIPIVALHLWYTFGSEEFFSINMLMKAIRIEPNKCMFYFILLM